MSLFSTSWKLSVGDWVSGRPLEPIRTYLWWNSLVRVTAELPGWRGCFVWELRGGLFPSCSEFWTPMVPDAAHGRHAGSQPSWNPIILGVVGGDSWGNGLDGNCWCQNLVINLPCLWSQSSYSVPGGFLWNYQLLPVVCNRKLVLFWEGKVYY